MLSEAKIFLESLTHFRQLLNEGVGESTVVDAINKHKIVHIYYAGDNTIEKGYRTIKPMVLGWSKSKEAETSPYMLLRAWEIQGNSDSKKKYADHKGRLQYGWRLFRVDKITSFIPTGRFFSTEEKKFPMPNEYNPNDSQMKSIVAAVTVTSGKPQTNVQGAVTQQQVPAPADSAFAGQKEKFQYFSKMGKRQRDATKEEIEGLWNWANKKRSKASREKLLVVTDEHGDLVLKSADQKTEIPPESIVGNLKDLYIKLVQPNQAVDNSFFQKTENDTIRNMTKDNIPKENTEKKDFFKNQ